MREDYHILSSASRCTLTVALVAVSMSLMFSCEPSSGCGGQAVDCSSLLDSIDSTDKRVHYLAASYPMAVTALYDEAITGAEVLNSSNRYHTQLHQYQVSEGLSLALYAASHQAEIYAMREVLLDAHKRVHAYSAYCAEVRNSQDPSPKEPVFNYTTFTP